MDGLPRSILGFFAETDSLAETTKVNELMINPTQRLRVQAHEVFSGKRESTRKWSSGEAVGFPVP